MVHGAPDYHKKVIMPPVDIEVQDLGVYPAWETNISEDGWGSSDPYTMYTVPENKILYVLSLELMIDNDSENRQGGYMFAYRSGAPGGNMYFIYFYVAGKRIDSTSRIFPAPVKMLAGNYIHVGTSSANSSAMGRFWGHLTDI